MKKLILMVISAVLVPLITKYLKTHSFKDLQSSIKTNFKDFIVHHN